MAGCCGSATSGAVPMTTLPVSGAPVQGADTSYVSPAAPENPALPSTDFSPSSQPDVDPSYVSSEGPTNGTGMGDPGSLPVPSQAGGWTPAWDARFRQLKLDPADLAYLAQAGFSDSQLEAIATALNAEPEVSIDGAGSQPGIDPATPGSSQPDSTASAWNSTWEQKFRDLLQRAGLPQADIDGQISQVRNQPISQEQLQQVYDQMNSQLGGWSPAWQKKFRDLFTKAKMPAEQIDQALAGMAQSGMSEQALAKAYADAQKAIADSEAASKPGWNASWEKKFTDLDIPKELMTQLKDAKAPESFLKSTYESLLSIKKDFQDSGKLKELEQAHANSAEKWGMMIEPGHDGGFVKRKVSEKDWDKSIESIKSSHVSGWKRIGSFALNLIPGVGALQYLTGKDWITGEKIDRSNPLNIAGAVLSAVSVVPMVGGISSALKGASALGRTAITAGSAGLRGAEAGALAANVAGKLGTSEKVAAGLIRMGTPMAELSNIDKLKKAFDITKMVIPGLNKFGVAGQMSSMGRGFSQLNAFSNTFSATIDKLDNVAGGNRMKSFLMQADDTANISRALSADEISTITKVTGMKPEEIIKIRTAITPSLQGEAALFRQGTKLWRFNPMANQATVEAGVSGGGRVARLLGREAASAETLNLGRGINTFGRSTMNTADFANVASRMTGTELADLGTRLGVGQGTRFRALAQIRRVLLPGSEQAYMSDAMRAAHRGSDLFAFTSRIAGSANRMLLAPSISMIGAGIVSGQMRQPAQAAWDYYKQRDEIAAQQKQDQAEIERKYTQESAALDQAWAEYQASQAQPVTATR